MNIVLNISTAPATLPNGVTAGLLALFITDTLGNPVKDLDGQVIATQKVEATSATFLNVAAGDYLANAVRLDKNGTAIGEAVKQIFSVAASTFDAPQTITVTLA